MSKKRIEKFIIDIERGTAINLPRFLNDIGSLNLDYEIQNTDIDARKQEGDFYIVKHINAELMSALKTLLDTGASRVEASRQNRSHEFKVSGSFILVREGLKDPEVIVVDGDGGYRATLKYSLTALIVENRQNFIDIDKMINFLTEQTAFKYEEGINVIYAEGNQITNSLNKQFLSRYEHIYICADFDLGGLRIANNLMRLLPASALEFLVPRDIEERLDRIQECVSNDYLDQVVELGLCNAKLANYAQIIKNKKKILEQEGYLHG